MPTKCVTVQIASVTVLLTSLLSKTTAKTEVLNFAFCLPGFALCVHASCPWALREESLVKSEIWRFLAMLTQKDVISYLKLNTGRP